MIPAGLNSLFQHIRQPLKIRRSVVQHEGRPVISRISIVQGARPARVISIVQQAQPARLELSSHTSLLIVQGQRTTIQRKILDSEQCPVSFGHRDADRIQLRIEQISPVWWRFHPQFVDALCIRPFGNVFCNGAEARAGLCNSFGKARLTGKLMRKCILLRQPQSVLPRRGSQRVVPF